MLQIDFSNIFKVGETHGVSKREFTHNKKLLKKYLSQFLERGQHFHEILDDKKTIDSIKQYAKEVKGEYDDIVVLGIGGSALGTICLKQSLKHLYKSEIPESGVPRLHVVDNIDPVLIEEVREVIDLKRALFLVISKSGSTPESMSAFLYFREEVAKQGLAINRHFVCITDPGQSPLRSIAEEEGMEVFDHPPVGGRFSVLSIVGLLPAALSGIHVDRLIAGAKEMREAFLSNNFAQNVPFQLAAVQYMLAKKGKTINVLMPYAQKLLRFADWYGQLLAESIGKQIDRDGKEIYAGITPVKALGATDQHSQTQLYNEGPNDKLIMFMQVLHPTKSAKIPFAYSIKELEYLKGASFNSLMEAELMATADAYTKYQRPNLMITIDKIDEYHLGQLFVLFEGATAFLGEYFNVDAFNQPGVELAKVLTRKYLSTKRV